MYTNQDQVTELLHLHTSLEGELEFTALDDNVGEVEQMDLERIWEKGMRTGVARSSHLHTKHSLSCHDDLFGLFFDR